MKNTDLNCRVGIAVDAPEGTKRGSEDHQFGLFSLSIAK